VAALPVGVAALAVVQSVSAAEPPWLFLPLQIAAFVAVAQACHGRLAERRPHPARLTEFYLCVAAGGVLGSAFNTLVAPQAFEWVVEYPLVLGLGVLLGVFGRGDAVVSSGPVRAGIPRRLLWAAAVLVALAPAIALAAGRTRGGVILALIGLPLALLFATRHPAVQVGVIAGVLLAPLALRDDDGARIFAGRSFFGVHRVLAEDGGRWHVLQHGTTVHGRQSFAPAERRQPFAYYHPAGPVGDVMAAFDPDRAKRVAVIGLGSGGLSAYARPGDHWTFLEIDPLVERIARTPALFTHLTDCGAACRVILGDGRVSLREMPDRAFDLILLDAFTSDAIPVHLLTREAVREYMTKLAPAGMLVFHVSNRYLNLVPTVSSAGADAGLAVGVREHRATAAQRVEGPLSSRWIAMSPDAGSLRPLFERGWVAPPEGATAWSDDYSNVLAVMQWRRPAARDEGNGR
jgi:protein-L-isoaspartate O-methyltransferase